MPKQQAGDRRRLSQLGAAVREARSDAGLSQEAAGHQAGLDRTYISGLERGRRNPTVVTLWRIAEALGTTPSALLAYAEARRAV
ncbi:MAG TPA: helix-turn-helix transcriptional regulator [Caulobacteraceae bacterium]|nr:helix-turn-helix transcriptional regulator [Caulobacteraceae bacterium]